MKSRFIGHLVTLTLAVALATAVCQPAFADTSASSGVHATVLKPGTKPGAQPTTGEPENGGGTTPLPTSQIQRLAQIVAPNLNPVVFWQLLMQWLSEHSPVGPKGRTP